MIRAATAEDRSQFEVLWAEFLRDANKAGADVIPNLRNLSTMMNFFDLYVSGGLDGVVLISIGAIGQPTGVTMSGEPQRPQAFDSEFGRIANGWGTYVREAYRGEGVSRLLREEMCDRCRELGFDVVFGFIAFSNEASMESCKKMDIEIPSIVAVKRLIEV